MASNPQPPAVRIALLAIPGAALLALALGVGSPAIAPSPGPLIVAGLLIVVGLLTLERLPRLVDPLLILVSTLAAGWILLRPGFPNGHDVLHHLWGLFAFGEAVRDGDLFPRWLHQLGLGMPLLQFYPPGSFYLALPLALAGVSPVAMLEGSLLLSSLLAGLSMYVAVRSTPCSRAPALVAAVAYTWAPYAQFDRLYRVALAESVALVFAPMALATTVRALRTRRRRDIALAAVLLGLLTLTHPLATSMIGSALVGWVAVEWWPSKVGLRRSSHALAGLAAVGLLAALLCGFYLLPIAVEARHTSISEAVSTEDGVSIARHGLDLDQILLPRRWDRWLISEPTGSEADEKGREPPFYLGLPLLAALLGAPLLASRRAESGNPAERDRRIVATAYALSVVGLVALALCLRPLDQLLALAPWWRILQFPWRWLLVTTVAGAWCSGLICQFLQDLATERDSRRLGQTVVPAILALAFVVDGAPYSGAPSWFPDYEGVALLSYDPEACESGGECWRTHGFALTDSSDASGPVRLYADRGVPLLPPTEPGSGAGLVFGVYPEYFTPAVGALFADRSQLPQTLTRTGVSWVAVRGMREVGHLVAPAPYAEWMGADGRTLPLAFERGHGRITLSGVPDRGTVVVREQSFPGWRVGRGGDREPAASTPDGFLTTTVEAGRSEVRFTFTERRWDRAVGWILSALGLVVVLWLASRRSGSSAGADRPRINGDPGTVT